MNTYRYIVIAIRLMAALVILGLPVVFRPYVIAGNSMSPTLEDAQVVLIDVFSLQHETPRRGDLLVLHNPHKREEVVVKRVVGLPGEGVEVDMGETKIRGLDGLVTHYASTTLVGAGAHRTNVLEAAMNLGPEDYYVMGDHRSASLDSRRFGAAQRVDFIGRPVLIIWPLKDFRLL